MTPPNLSLVLIMVCFWVTFWLVHRLLIKPVGGVLAERRHRIDSAHSAWASKHEEYVSATSRLQAEMEEAGRAAARIRSELRQQALDERSERLGTAREQADQRLRTALDELAADAEQARAELRRRADGLARAFASRLLEREV